MSLQEKMTSTQPDLQPGHDDLQRHEMSVFHYSITSMLIGRPQGRGSPIVIVETPTWQSDSVMYKKKGNL
jgi:hypothetical protein